ncbi:MAG: MaoC family dehydratase, partial [Hyphomicrobiaceae bacterium]
MSEPKTTSGNFFEDFRLGQHIVHATPRTVTHGDVALYTGLYGSRFAVQSADPFATAIGYPRSPVDDMLVFHVIFGKTVPDISLNAVANLGYADCRFLAPVYPGDTLSADSEVIGLKENSNRETGVVYVRSSGRNQRGETVLSYVRWVMVRKRTKDAAVPATEVPALPSRVEPSLLGQAVPSLKYSVWDNARSGSRFRWGDYAAGERIDHVDGMTI